MHKISLYTISILLIASLPACARTKSASSSGAGSVQILEATQQRTKPGRQDMAPFTIFRFRVIWKSKEAPTEFFWRPDEKGWLETHVAKPMKRPGLAPGDFMVIERNMEAKAIRYGDTVILTTRRHVHDEEPMSSAVKKMPVSSLYFQTSAAGKWMFTPVSIRKLPDIMMP